MQKKKITSKGQTMSIVNKEEQFNKNSNSAEELIKRTPVPNTPFIIIEIEGKMFGAFGKYKITEDYKPGTSVEQAKLDLQLITWNRLVQIISLINQMFNESKTKN